MYNFFTRDSKTLVNNKKESLIQREIKITTDYTSNPESSILIEIGKTKVICNVTIESNVPPFLRDSGKGWVTAEYSMLPRATKTRMKRESMSGKISGRTAEIQRMIGRSLRAVIDLTKMDGHTAYVDCDVIEADGGTRTAAITGAAVALYIAFEKKRKKEEKQDTNHKSQIVNNAEMRMQNAEIPPPYPPHKCGGSNTPSLASSRGGQIENPMKELIAAVSVGIYNGEVVVDLDYEMDSNAQVDMNVVMTETGKFVEIQGTGEEFCFSQEQLDMMLIEAKKAIENLIRIQRDTICKSHL